jgi:hypothetical protein
MPDRLPVAVTFDQRGYVASGEGLPTITALSLAGLRRRIDEHLSGQDVIPRLVLDKRARVERDQRRAGGCMDWPTTIPRRTLASQPSGKHSMHSSTSWLFNLKTSKALDLDVPVQLQQRADYVIERILALTGCPSDSKCCVG